MITLRKHQQEAYDSWISEGAIGIIKAITGTGKTFVALKAVEANPSGILITVPTVALQTQWSNHLKAMGLEHGLVGNGKMEVDKPITVGITNSLIKLLDMIDIVQNNDEMFEKSIFNCRLLIMDEMHHMVSPENYRMLTRIKYVSVMGLSATPETEDSTRYDALVARIPIVYEHDLEDAQEQGTICKFDTKTIACELLPEEREKYDEQTAIIRKVMPMYGFSFKLAMMSIRRGGQGPAKEMSAAVQERKRIVAGSLAKADKAAEIIKENPTRIIVFSERIECLYRIGDKVPNRMMYYYHSKMKKKDKKDIIESFKKDPTGVLLSAKALDEGIDVPDCDFAIMVSGSASKRQFTQRLGRILRPKEGKSARLIELYIKDSVEEKWMKKRKA